MAKRLAHHRESRKRTNAPAPKTPQIAIAFLKFDKALSMRTSTFPPWGKNLQLKPRYWHHSQGLAFSLPCFFVCPYLTFVKCVLKPKATLLLLRSGEFPLLPIELTAVLLRPLFIVYFYRQCNDINTLPVCLTLTTLFNGFDKNIFLQLQITTR